MKLFRIIRCVTFAVTAAVAVTFCADASAKKTSKVTIDPYQDYNEDLFMDMDFEPNLATPIVDPTLHAPLIKLVRKTAESLRGKNVTVDLMREGEVIVLSIPSDRLFLPNDTLFGPDAQAALAPLSKVLQDPMLFKVVLAMHTDNTGSEEYLEYLSSARLNSVNDWFLTCMDNGVLSEQLIIIPYSMAASMPVTDNLTHAHRSENRRLEIYLVPGPKLIEEAMAEQ